MTVRVYEQSQFNTPAELTPFLDAGYKTGWGTPLFRIGPLKMVADGSLGARTAYMSTHYADAPDEKGLAIFTREQLTEMLTLAHERGMQSAVHAIGDGILDDILLQRITAAEQMFQDRRERPFSRQELAVLFAAMLMEP
jgi:predicted amidohydrolase YtcJ